MKKGVSKNGELEDRFQEKWNAIQPIPLRQCRV